MPIKEEIVRSWDNVFNYKKEKRDASGGISEFGLRPPQIGALHAIQAHWSISNKPAIVVMPTGTGKTETMLCLTIAEKLNGLLVIVPTDSLRTQIFNKFKSLGILKDLKFKVISLDARNPVVGFLKTRITTLKDAQALFQCNVIISTPQIITSTLKGSKEIRSEFLKWCEVMIMDEAHHSQATEWSVIKQNIESFDKPVLLFTATPFRNDKKRLQGTVIYNYPLSLAQRDNYYKDIIFHYILEFNPKLADKLIADKAVQILRNDLESKLDHILMARVDQKEKAQWVFDEIYSKHADLNPVIIHSDISDKKLILEQIKLGKHQIIVCVDMLGEGFDLPQLKVCALHDLHKNITTSFQFFGRFTRESSLRLGNASVVANIADPKLKGTLKKLYQKDSDWNNIISIASGEIIGEVVKEENFFKNFSETEIPDKIPLRNITPAMSTVVFKLYDQEISWNPGNYKKYFNADKYDATAIEHNEEKLLVSIVKEVGPVKWGKIDDLLNCSYDLYIVYLNVEQKLLYINSTNNSTTHNRLAEAIVGENIDLFNEAKIYRCLDGIFQLELFNLGLKSILDGPISFTMYAGNGIVSGLDELDNKTKSSSNLFGVGYEGGEKISIGCSSKGRVWTKLVKTIPDFCDWCNLLGTKLLDESIDTDNIFSFIQKPEYRTTVPNDVIPVAVVWNEELYAYPLMATFQGIPLADFKIELSSSTINSVCFKITIEEAVAEFKLTLEDNSSGRGYFYSLVSKIPVVIEYRKQEVRMEELFYEFPPTVRFHDNSKMYNNILFRFKGDFDLFDTRKILPVSWGNVNISKESQREEKRKDSIQFHIINMLQSDENYKIIFDDDSANEASDIIAVKYWNDAEYKISVDLYHCKFSSTEMSGARLKDIYEVNGQAQRSFHWKHQAIELLNHMIRRENSRINKSKNSRYERGGNEDINVLLNMLTSGYCNTEFNIYVVQPGLSKKLLIKKPEHLSLLGATDLLMKKTGNNFYVITDN